MKIPMLSAIQNHWKQVIITTNCSSFSFSSQSKYTEIVYTNLWQTKPIAEKADLESRFERKIFKTTQLRAL